MSIDGILLVDKPEGISSARVVSIIKRRLNVKKVGHTGTLDPFATGLLPIAVGKATRLSRFYLGGNKAYEATVKLGEKTDTYDKTGEVVATAEPEIEPNSILESTFTNARPPGIMPIMALAAEISRRAIPPLPIIWPDKIKKGMASKVKLLIPPTIRWEMVVTAGAKSILINIAASVARAMETDTGTLISSSATNTNTSNNTVNIRLPLRYGYWLVYCASTSP